MNKTYYNSQQTQHQQVLHNSVDSLTVVTTVKSQPEKNTGNLTRCKVPYLMGKTMFLLSKFSNGSSLSFRGPPAWGMLGSVADGSAMSLHSHNIMFGSLVMTSHHLGHLPASSSAISAARPSPPPKSSTDAAGCPAGRRLRAEKCCSWAAVAKVAGLTTSPISLRISTSRPLVR